MIQDLYKKYLPAAKLYMKYRIELLKADVLDELDKINRIKLEFDKVQAKIQLLSEEVGYYDRGAIGYLLHNFYNGCENIFQLAAIPRVSQPHSLPASKPFCFQSFLSVQVCVCLRLKN